uniref:ATP synthase subunit epsilon, mitochondrial n=1 Tax=Seriola lalandi dorsalis TaxID=1841481 RepID=A0A3B4WX14_SERLL
MSTWRHVGMTYLKYADLCATHVTNCLKEPRKSKRVSAACRGELGPCVREAALA